eukprot:COSAG03_NODE_12106_length_560_cov_41.058568_1_plen_112_part_01
MSALICGVHSYVECTHTCEYQVPYNVAPRRKYWSPMYAYVRATGARPTAQPSKVSVKHLCPGEPTLTQPREGARERERERERERQRERERGREKERERERENQPTAGASFPL